MAVVGQLLVELSANVARLRTDMDRASMLVESNARRMQTAASAVTGALGAIGVGVSMAGLASSFKGVVDQLDAFNDLADKTGVSVERLSSLQNTLAPFGVSLDQIGDVAGKLVRAMSSADDETSKAAEAFKLLGVSTQDAQGNLRPVDDVLVDVAQSLSQYEDGANKTALAQALLGKSGAEYLPLLKDLAGANRQAATVTAEQAARAEELNIALNALGNTLNILKVEAFTPIISVMAGFARDLQELTARTGNFSASLKQLLEVGDPQANLQRAIDKIRELAVIRAEYVNGTRTRADRAIDFLNNRDSVELIDKQLRALTQYVNARKQLSQMRDESQVMGPPSSLARRTQAPSLSGGSSSSNSNARELASVEDYAARIQRLAADAVTSSDIAKAREYADTLAELDRLYFDAGLSADVYESAVRRLTRTTTVDGSEAERKQAEALQKSVDAYLAMLDPLKKYRDQLAEVQRLVDMGALSSSQAADLSVIIGQQAVKASEDIDKLRDAGRDAFDELQRSIEGWGDRSADAITKFVTTGEGGFRGMVDAMIADLLRLQIQQTATRPLFTFLTDAIRGFNWGSLFGGGAGNMPDFSPEAAVGARANGGPVMGGYPYLVGERGPELFVPGASGAIVPNERIGGNAVNLTYNIAAGVTASEVLRALQATREQTKADILESMRRGGAFQR